MMHISYGIVLLVGLSWWDFIYSDAFPCMIRQAGRAECENVFQYPCESLYLLFLYLETLHAHGAQQARQETPIMGFSSICNSENGNRIQSCTVDSIYFS
jgi:hypothetical protein